MSTATYGIGVTVTWNGDAAVDAVRAALMEGINMAAERLLALSQELCPVDTGNLRRSGSVQEASMDGLQAWVSYNTPYAVRLHENPQYDFSHAKNPKAQGKYLEAPLVNNGDELIALVQTHVAKALR